MGKPIIHNHPGVQRFVRLLVVFLVASIGWADRDPSETGPPSAPPVATSSTPSLVNDANIDEASLVPQLIPSDLPDNPLGDIPVPVPTNAKTIEVHDLILTASSIEVPVEWSEKKSQIVKDIPHVLAALQRKAYDLQEQLPQDEFIKRIERNKVEVTVKGFGKAQYNRIDDQIFIRATHDVTGLSIIFLDKNRISPNSRHLGRYIARQHILAGEEENGRKNGRDVVIVWQDGTDPLTSDIVHYEYRPRFPPGTPEWWKEYWLHLCDGKREAKHYMIAAYSTALQLGALSAVNWMKIGMGWDSEFNWVPLGVSTISGLLVGLWSDVYKNWTYNGTTRAKVLKMAAYSTFHTYSFALWQDGAWKVFRIFDKEAILYHVHFGMNIFLSKIGRTPWQRYVEIKDNARDNPDPVRVPTNKVAAEETARSAWNYLLRKMGRAPKNAVVEVPAIDEVRETAEAARYVDLSRSQVWAQTLYVVPFTLSWMGRAGLGLSGLALPLIDVNVDWGDIALLSSIPIANTLVWWDGWRKQRDIEPELRANMKRSWSPVVAPVLAAGGALKWLLEGKASRPEVRDWAKRNAKNFLIYPMLPSVASFIARKSVDLKNDFMEVPFPIVKNTITTVIAPATKRGCGFLLSSIKQVIAEK